VTEPKSIAITPEGPKNTTAANAEPTPQDNEVKVMKNKGFFLVFLYVI
jgi:hypothetical protein